jgi:hypothetical protein
MSGLLPFREPSNLAEPACAQLILARSGVNMGQHYETMIRAAELALRVGRERVQPELIEVVAGIALSCPFPWFCHVRRRMARTLDLLDR